MSPRGPQKQELLDYLAENYYDTVDRASTAVKLGIVYVNGKLIKRSGIKIDPIIDKVQIVGDAHLFVSRGGYKLQYALQEFNMTPKGKVCLDIGASTGGFTDCMLQYGADFVYSVDTGYGQLDWELRKNERVMCCERTNVRYLLPDKLYKPEVLESNQKASFIVVDVSFISVLKLIPSIQRLSIGVNHTEIIVLIKPQFEAGKNKVGRGGVIRNPNLHFDIVLEFIHGCYRAGLDIHHLTHSPILGSSGNLEFLAHLSWPKAGRSLNPKLEEWVKQVIETAYGVHKLN